MKKYLALLAGLLLIAACTSKDTTKPTISIAYPENNDSLDVGSIPIKAVATDDKEMDKVEFTVDGNSVGSDNSANADTFEATWTATAGAHNIVAKAIDKAGNENTATVSVVVDTVSGPSGPTYHDTIPPGGETWYPSGNPHIVRQDLGIDSATLTIMPGCTVKFEPNTGIGCGWNANLPGALVAVGKPDSVIVFMSNSIPPVPWRGLRFWGATISASTRFDYCKISHAGLATETAIELYDTYINQFEHSSIRNSAGYGITYGNWGYIENFSNDTIVDCTDFPIRTYPAALRMLGAGCSFLPNTKAAILVDRGGVEDASGTWRNHGVPYIVDGTVWIADHTSGGSPIVTIERGTSLQFTTNGYIEVGTGGGRGGLYASGSSQFKIIFSSSAATPAKGDWYGIEFGDAAVDDSCVLRQCKVEYGGREGLYGNVAIHDALPTIEDCSIGYSAAWGVFCDGAQYPDTLDLLLNQFYGNDSGDIRTPP